MTLDMLKSTKKSGAEAVEYSHTYYNESSLCELDQIACGWRVGRLRSVRSPLGLVSTVIKYDVAGRPVKRADFGGMVTEFAYDRNGALTHYKVRGSDGSTETDDAVTRIEYEPTGLIGKVIQPDGAYTAYQYDAAHRLIAIEDNYGDRIAYTLDNAGNRIKEDTTDKGGVLLRTLSRVYNQLGQLQMATGAYGHAIGYTYDAAGRTDTVTDALGRVTDNDYDPLGRLARTLQDATGIAAETKFEYDALDNLTKITDPKGLDTNYQYNAFGDLTRLDSPDTGLTTYTYDNAGNRVSATDARGKLTVYTYDAINRLTGIGYDTPGLNVSYIYDIANKLCPAAESFAIGRLSKMQDASGSTQYCYDRHGNVTRKVQVTAGRRFRTRYVYTLAGRLRAVRYPSGTWVRYRHNALGQPTRVTVTPPGGTRQVLLSRVTYYPCGPAAELTYGDGRELKRSRDENYRPGFVEDVQPGGLSLGFQFDAVGNLMTLRRGDQSEPPLRQYAYDALNRLTEVREGSTDAVLATYNYDATGNRTSATIDGVSSAYRYPADSHRLTRVAAQRRRYDAAGNTISIGGNTRRLFYNAAGRMSAVKRNGAVVMRYRYNGKGEQVRRFPDRTSTAQTFAVYDEAGRVLGRYDHTGQRVQEYIWLGSLPVGVIAGDALYYVQADHLGTPRTVIDPSRQTAVWNWPLTGEAFGAAPPDADPDGNGVAFVFDLRFPGQQYDAASGLNYNYFRDYEPGTGRYVQSDPVGLAAGVSTYAYVWSNPVLGIDPFGLVRCKQVWEVTREYDGYTRSTTLERSKVSQNCIPFPELATPGAKDMIPDPMKLLRRQFPLSIPVEFGLWCRDTYYRRSKIEQAHVKVIGYYERCVDDCGNQTSKTLIKTIDQTDWRTLRHVDELISSPWRYYAPGINPGS